MPSSANASVSPPWVGSETSGSPFAEPSESSITLRSARCRRSSPNARNPYSASLNVGSLRSSARFTVDASTAPPEVRSRPATVWATRTASSSMSPDVRASTGSVSSAGGGAAASFFAAPDRPPRDELRRRPAPSGTSTPSSVS